MKERPILFNADMVRAVLDGRKMQTRRVMKVQPHAGVRNSPLVKSGNEDGHGKELVCPFGEVGDRLWVRETWARYNIDQDSHDMASIHPHAALGFPHNAGDYRRSCGAVAKYQ
jgi:hypothetical protein